MLSVIDSLISLIEVIFVVLPVLLAVAFVTIAERKTMGSMHRRLGPNIVGIYGILQPFADALKLILKEYIAPTQANKVLFFIGPIINLVFALYGYGVVPYGPGIALLDFNLGILYMLAMSSLATYGILLAGWSANSKYAFLGSLRSTAQLISYELILSSAVLLVVYLSGSLSLTVNIEAQKVIWYIIPLIPVFIIFFIGSVAETNRAPFDLAEAESELVSGYMTEHSAVIFVFFFLSEYASIVLICVLISILFLGGYLYDIGIVKWFFYNFNLIVQQLNYYMLLFNINLMIQQLNCYVLFYLNIKENLLNNTLFGLSLGLKSCVMIFIFIWVRAAFPRIRFDQLMAFCWTVLLPIVIAFIIYAPCFLQTLSSFACNISLL